MTTSLSLSTRLSLPPRGESISELLCRSAVQGMPWKAKQKLGNFQSALLRSLRPALTASASRQSAVAAPMNLRMVVSDELWIAPTRGARISVAGGEQRRPEARRRDRSERDGLYGYPECLEAVIGGREPHAAALVSTGAARAARKCG
jgi:hypothetical protein